MTSHLPVQFWLLLAIGAAAIAPGTYVIRYIQHSPFHFDITQPREDLSWRSPATFGLCLAGLLVLASLGLFIFTPAAANFARSPIFWPLLLVGVAAFAGYQVVQGLRTGSEEPLIRGFYTSYSRATQAKRYWASIVWNSALALVMLSAAGLAFVQGRPDRRRERCYDVQSTYPPNEVLASCNELVEKTSSSGGRDFGDALMARGNAYYRLNDEEHAVADYSRALRLEPNDADLWENRGSAYLRMRRGEQAVADFNEAVRLKPDWKKYFNRGYTYQTVLNDPFDAIQDYSAALSLKPNLAEVLADRGYCYGETGDYERAAADFSQVIRLKPKAADGYYLRSLAYRRTGDIEQAQADFETALRIDPQFLNHLRARRTGVSL